MRSLLCYLLLQVTLYSIYVAMMAFTAKISDPAVGGTYMTLLNTITNLGMIYGLTCICCVALWGTCLMIVWCTISVALLQWFLRRRNNRDFYPLCIWNVCVWVYDLMIGITLLPTYAVRNRHDLELIVTFLPWLHSRVIGLSWHDVDDCVAHRREFKTTSRLLFF